MRLLAEAKVEERRGDTAQLEWRIKSAAGGTNRYGSPAAEGEGEVVRFNFRAISGTNPLSLYGLRRLGLPEKISNRGGCRRCRSSCAW
jgi:type VI secretion system protein ImpL